MFLMVGRDGGKEKYLELSSSTSYPSACSWELVEGVSVAGNINTLACMKVRSGRLAITFTASSLRCSSLFGFLSAMRKDQCVNGVSGKSHSLSRLAVSSLGAADGFSSASCWRTMDMASLLSMTWAWRHTDPYAHVYRLKALVKHLPSRNLQTLLSTSRVLKPW